MLFRPSFCANCGEKVERERWGLLTSRRFCQVCESQYKGHDLLLRVIIGIGVLSGIFGFGSYLKSGAGENARVLRMPAKVSDLESSVSRAKPSTSAPNASTVANAGATKPAAVATAPPPWREAPEPTFYCGAETKKGTPCSRRVKAANARCYQHAGMRAAGPVGKGATQGN